MLRRLWVFIIVRELAVLYLITSFVDGSLVFGVDGGIRLRPAFINTLVQGPSEGFTDTLHMSVRIGIVR